MGWGGRYWAKEQFSVGYLLVDRLEKGMCYMMGDVEGV